MASPVVEIVELVPKKATKQGEITFIHKDNIDLSQIRKIANIISNFAINRNPDWTAFFEWKVITDGDEKLIAFGLATEYKDTILPLPDSGIIINELRFLVTVLICDEEINPAELVQTIFPNLEDARLVELLVQARTTFLQLLGGKPLKTDIRVLINGQTAGKFLTQFPSAPKLEPDPLPIILTGRILTLGENSLEFQDEINGKFTVDFNPTQFFNYLKARFVIPSLRIQLSTEGEGDNRIVALNTIANPAIGVFDGEPLQLFP